MCIGILKMEEGNQPAKKRRRLCPCCNQMLAKTTYWEHQRRYHSTSTDCVNVNSEYSSSDSEFELNYDAYMENEYLFDDNYTNSHDNELQDENFESEADEGT